MAHSGLGHLVLYLGKAILDLLSIYILLFSFSFNDCELFTPCTDKMPSIMADMEFLADLPLYKEEKPFMYLPGKDENLDPDRDRLSNLEFEHHEGIRIEDMRDRPELFLDRCGFEYCSHNFRVNDFDSASSIDTYRDETQQFLTKRFQAVKVLTYEVRQRRNEHFQRKQFDFFDKMLVEGPAKGAHNGKLSEVVLGSWLTFKTLHTTRGR